MEMDDATEIGWSDDDADDDASGDNLFSTKRTTGPMDSRLLYSFCLPARRPHIVDIVVAQHQSPRLRDSKPIAESLAWVVHDLPLSWRTRRRDRNDNDPDANMLGHCCKNDLVRELVLANARDPSFVVRNRCRSIGSEGCLGWCPSAQFIAGQEHPVNPTEILSEAVGQFAHRIPTTSTSAQLLNGRGSNLLMQGAHRLEEMMSVEIPQHLLVGLMKKNMFS